jgi:thioredoxin-like negative regulator of GroEL
MLVWVVAASACQGSGKVKEIGEAEFRKKIYEFESGRVGPFQGKRPAIVDFYADWCKPCLAMAPIFDEIALKYAGKIDVYRVDVKREDMLALDLGVRQLPTLFFISGEGHTQIEVNALNREKLMEMAEQLVSQ